MREADQNLQRARELQERQLVAVAALDEARANDTILCAGIGAGATAVLLTAGRGLARIRRKGPRVADQMAGGRTVDYIAYLKNRRMLSSRTGSNG